MHKQKEYGCEMQVPALPLSICAIFSFLTGQMGMMTFPQRVGVITSRVF